MDVGAVAIAVIGAIGGAVATGVGAMLRARTSRRTAARLVYAELESNSAIVAFYRSMGVWPAAATSRKAWDANSEVLARTRETDLFQTVSRGYAALEAVAYIAQGRSLSKPDAEELLLVNVGLLNEALRSVGTAGMIPAAQLHKVVARLSAAAPSRNPAAPPLGNVPVSLLSQMVDLQRAVGRRPALEAPAAVPVAPVPESAALRVYDAGNLRTIPTRPVRTEDGPPSADPAVEDAFAAMTHTVRFYREALGRDLVADAGGTLRAVVHFGKNYANVYWDGRHIVIGDGDGVNFGPFAPHLDIMAHELTHILLESSGLEFAGQTGSLIESFADVLGSLVKQFTLGQSAGEADWLIGDGLVVSDSRMALRSLKAPGTAFDDDRLGRDPQVADMADYVATDDDNGGVHINSGIPSHAFYLLAVALGGAAWERAGPIWYRALTGGALPAAADFATFAGVTLDEAGPDAVEAVRAAWKAVGVTPAVHG
ncbi:M4 family metallopeptidase [Actinoplanes sp. KI2]|uniref:M4 family metallopeptidase n=1 Tax=Actinoplanes sp. KI2 TaxID=2983315 RepID=UPI0021D56CD4|nr:M4 family metallopeptidase [Actinoplanes sp. KI2]MCU7725795.1 M4 family metallopeptidase [Actinoplanes sp. KI2]